MATVTVRGRATADVPPDRAQVVVAVQGQAATGAEALALVADRSAAVDTALDAVGDLVLLRRPAAVTLSPVWNDRREVTGQAARRTVQVDAEADGPLGELLAGLAEVPGAAIESTEWIVDPTNPVHSELRTAAVKDAHARAEDYAGAAGLRLGTLEWISEPDVRPGDGGWVQTAQKMSRFAGLGDSGAVLELRPEPVGVSAAVDVRYALLT